MTIDDYREMEPQQIETLIESLVNQALKKSTYKTGYNWLKRNTPQLESSFHGNPQDQFRVLLRSMFQEAAKRVMDKAMNERPKNG